MLILFPSVPYDRRQPDESFIRELRAAKAAGFETALIDIDQLDVKGVPCASIGSTAIYRGWMLTPSKYTELYRLLWSRDVKLINEPAEYRYAHELPGWYADFEGATPRSVWFPDGQSFEDQLDGKPRMPNWEAIIKEVTLKLGDGPYIVKDYVKSRKHEWAEACFIEGPDDIKRVAKCFVERQGEDLVGGLVFRKYIPFWRVGEHPKSGAPILNEVRTWTVRGGPLTGHTYWGPDEGGDNIVMPHGLIDIVDLNGEGSAKQPLMSWRVKSNFFTMDLAMLKEGGWAVIELGDGQVAGLPEHVDAEQFYRKLKERFV